MTAIGSEELFGNKRPLILDIGCGRGEFTVEQAKRFPQRNYVGIDTHAKSLYVAINRAAAARVNNLKFIRIDAENGLQRIEDDGLAEIYLLFPPPVLKEKYLHKDVITSQFVASVERTLGEDGRFHFVTDIPTYFVQKVALVQSHTSLQLVNQTESIEGGITRFQTLWEGYGELSYRALFTP